MGLRVRIIHDFGEAKAKLKAYPKLLNDAMYDASEEGTRIIANQLVLTTVVRTGMDPGMVDNMVRVEFGPSPGLIARGRVGFTKPPAYFYPKKSKVLRFTIGGRVIFARRVRGSRPYPLVGRAANLAENDVERNFGRALREVMP
jgi:hypothetical protein